MSNILVIGFQRSGTTLLRRLIHAHPNIVHCIHEKRVLNRGDLDNYLTKKLKLDIDIENDNWGEKVPWYDSSGNVIIDYSNRWLKKFGTKARILHIIRHPVDVANSNIKLGWASDSATVIKMHEYSIRNVCTVFKKCARYMEIQFEDLVIDPFVMAKEIFKLCDLDCSDEIVADIVSPGRDKWRYFEGINPDRAFAYKGKKST